MKKERKHYTGEEKVAILRRHLLDKVPVSDLREEHGLQPTVFYRWQKRVLREWRCRLSRQEPTGPPSRTAAHRFKKKSWGALTRVWVPRDVRDLVVDFVRCWSEKTEIKY
jgi:transposase-like protein